MLVDTPELFWDVLPGIANSPVLEIDLETTGLNVWGDSQMCGVAVQNHLDSYYFPFRHGEGQNLPLSLIEPLYKALAGSKVQHYHNAKFDRHFMDKDGYTPTGDETELDSMVAVHLLNENEPTLRLKDLGKKYIDPNAKDEQTALAEELKKRKLTGKGNMWKLPAALVEPYACEDVILTGGLHAFAEDHLQKRGMLDLFYEVSRYSELLYAIEKRGMLLDVGLVHERMAEAALEIGHMQSVIEGLAGYAINLNSHPQVQAWLKVKSSREEVLLTMLDKPGVAELMQYRAWKRAYTNYYQAFLDSMDEHNVLHPNLNITGTVSGRLSSSRPPMQAIPVKAEEDDHDIKRGMHKIKDVFIARPGFVLLNIDYRQAEMRIGAHYAQEDGIKELILSGVDLHSATAERLGIPRHIAKRINFGVIYGIGAKSLSKQINASQKEAARYLKMYHEAYPGFRQLYRRAETIAEERGYIRLFTGRRRHYNHPVKAPPHKAMSNLIQGSVGEVMRVTMTRLWDEVPEAHQLLQVHDDIMFEVPEDRVDELVPRIAAVMIDFPWLSVPMAVDAKVGPSWGLEEEYELVTT